MKHDGKMRIGIIGTGWIAEKAAITINGLEECEAFAVGSRRQETADAFAAKWGIGRAYGSYSALIADPDVDLVYIGTPHSHHFEVTREAILAGKPCLVEKAFMANAREAREINYSGRTYRTATIGDGHAGLLDGRQATHHARRPLWRCPA